MPSTPMSDQGGHVARFAGNFMWQTRPEDEGQRQVCWANMSPARKTRIYQSGDVTRATNSGAQRSKSAALVR